MRILKNMSFGILLIFFGCAKDALKPSELISWVNDPENGLVQNAEFGGFAFEVIYKPTDYVIAIEGRTDALSEARYTELTNELEGMQYIDLKIKAADGSGDALSGANEAQDDYYTRLDYFVSYAWQDIELIHGADTLSPQLYHFERTYGLSPYSTILLGFEKTSSRENRTLVIHDRVLGIGKMKFVFEEEKINQTPTLKRI